ncbi:MAG TPA: adenylate/guanylate cyclase domain-containing protein [Dehalococcoidia bacterium]|nr:adenylate/guanylate cyclase domain-containing protein [Dehalococcoidia bacterium]
MEPRIQYAQTEDGVSIAYWTLGEGMPLVEMPVPPWGHIQLEWQIPEWRRWYELLAEKRKLVRYDGRGSGLSERNVSDFSLDTLMLDLEAVVDRLSMERFALFGTIHSGPAAIAYAARHPERVSHLVLWCTYARMSDYTAPAQAQGLFALMDKDWELFTETVAHARLGWSEGEPARRFAAYMRESVTPEAAQAMFAVIDEFDVAALLPQVKSPVLVLHRRQLSFPEVDIARGLVSAIPDARLALLEGTPLVPYLGDTEAAVQAIDEFLGEGEEADTKAELPEGMAVILFADIVESTALTEQLGDTAFRAKARELDASLRGIIGECAGTPVEGKVLGDGVLAVFTSARQAIECALRCKGASEPVGLQLHLGIHAGDVIREGNNVYGGAVNIAARIAGASAPGEVLVSDTVRSLARTSAGVSFEDRGEHELKGVSEPQRLFVVREGDA